MKLEKVALELSEEAQKEGRVYDANGTFYGTLTTPDKGTWEEAEARGLTWDNLNKLPSGVGDQIRQIVREELAAHEERLRKKSGQQVIAAINEAVRKASKPLFSV